MSEAWGTLASTTISLLETVGAINEDAADDCIEEAAQLGEMNKKRMGFQARMQLLDAVTQMIEGFLGAFADLSDEQREEHGVAEIFENLYGSMFTIISESIEGIDKDGVTAKQSEELQQQIALTLRLIDVLIAVSFENDEESALVYFKPFISVLFELCCTQLCLGGDKVSTRTAHKRARMIDRSFSLCLLLNSHALRFCFLCCLPLFVSMTSSFVRWLWA